ncbi:MAG TPA: hypothetical protein VLW85_11495 [Myxococcales bacterium]|nr:hypothetical protein [Myxococcales bacterium]
MTEPCRQQYNACLSRCPTATPNPAGDANPHLVPQQEQLDVAHCTQACNEQAKSCK